MAKYGNASSVQRLHTTHIFSNIQKLQQHTKKNPTALTGSFWRSLLQSHRDKTLCRSNSFNKRDCDNLRNVCILFYGCEQWCRDIKQQTAAVFNLKTTAQVEVDEKERFSSRDNCSTASRGIFTHLYYILVRDNYSSTFRAIMHQIYLHLVCADHKYIFKNNVEIPDFKQNAKVNWLKYLQECKHCICCKNKKNTHRCSRPCHCLILSSSSCPWTRWVKITWPWERRPTPGRLVASLPGGIEHPLAHVWVLLVQRELGARDELLLAFTRRHAPSQCQALVLGHVFPENSTFQDEKWGWAVRLVELTRSYYRTWRGRWFCPSVCTRWRDTRRTGR